MSIYLPYQKIPRWNIDPNAVARNCDRMGLPGPGEGLELAMSMWGAGNKVYDYSGNRNSGNLNNIPWSNGNPIFADNSTIAIAHNSSLDFGDNFTFHFVVNSTDNLEKGYLLHKASESGGSRTIRIQFYNDGDAYDLTHSQILIGDAVGSWDIVWYPEVVPTLNEDTSFMLTYDGQTAKVYKKGVLAASHNNATASLKSTTDDWQIGDTNDSFNGKLKTSSWFSVALNAHQVQTLYSNPFGMFEPIRRPPIWGIPSAGQSALLSDTFSLSESFVPFAGYKASLVDSLNMSESQLVIGHYKRLLFDSLNMSESQLIIGQYKRSLSDSLDLNENTSPVGHFLKVLSDSISMTDALSVLAKLKASTSDTLNLTDSITVTANFKGTLSDTFTFTDNLSALLKALASLSDILTLTDSITYPAGQSASLSDTLSLTDSSLAKVSLLAAISDVFTLSGTSIAIANLKVILSDTFNLSDELSIGLIGNLVDTLILTDSVTNVGRFLTTLADTLILTDTSSGIIHFKVSLSDTLTFSEQISALASYAAAIIDTLNLTDEISGISIEITGKLIITITSSKPTITLS